MNDTENNEEILENGEGYKNSAPLIEDHFCMDISSITRNYLNTIGMTNDEIVLLHQAVWDLSLPFAKPKRRDKYSRHDAKEIKNSLEKKYNIDNYHAPLQGEPVHTSYEQSIDDVIDNMSNSSDILICGAPASGKTTLAKLIKRKAEKAGFNVTIFDEYSREFVDYEGPKITCTQYLSEDATGDTRIFVQASEFRKTLNAVKRFPLKPTPGFFTENLRLRYRYELDFQKSISNIVVDYSFGRVVLPYHLVKTIEHDSEGY